jgi:hypothetical protein
MTCAKRREFVSGKPKICLLCGTGNVGGGELTMTRRHVAMRKEILEGEQKAASDL